MRKLEWGLEMMSWGFNVFLMVYVTKSRESFLEDQDGWTKNQSMMQYPKCKWPVLGPLPAARMGSIYPLSNLLPTAALQQSKWLVVHVRAHWWPKRLLKTMSAFSLVTTKACRMQPSLFSWAIYVHCWQKGEFSNIFHGDLVSSVSCQKFHGLCN